MGTRTVSLIALLVILSAAPAVPVLGGERVRVEVEIIYASNQPRPTQRSLSGLRSQLQSTFNFASYHLLEKRAMELSRGRAGRVSIPGGKHLSVELEEVSQERAKLMIKISDRRREPDSTMISMSPGQTVLLGGYKYRDGSLIIAIRAVF